jgi:cysteinyl-tRNA synthetase
MTLRLFNTLTRSAEPFAALAPPAVSFYSCGPTVYNYAHIGNFRTFLFQDVLRRWLEASGFDVFHVMNLTDVDDKMIKGAQARSITINELALPFIEAFHADREYLRILPAHEYPRATDFIPAMIALVESLLAKGVAYRSDDGSVYFAIDKFPAYGKLSQLDRRELQQGASGRTAADEYAKEDARDFVLWKSVRPEDEAAGAAWDAPFGRGRPGWHLECSAMSLDLVNAKLGVQVLDIHGGGVDLIFPHHEDEIAQSCAHTGHDLFARYWVHGEFLTMSGTKMSKRFGNILTARDLREEGVDPGAVRLMLATTHYRSQLDFSDESLDSAREGSRRLGEFTARVNTVAGGDAGEEFAAAAAQLTEDFAAAMDDDLNTPRALAAMFEAVREGNRLLDAGVAPGAAFTDAWLRATWVLQVLPEPAMTISAVGSTLGIAPEAGDVPQPENPPTDAEGQAGWATWWLNQRQEARRRKDFAESDRIRDLLLAAGWEIRDGREGTVVVRR